MFFNTYAALCAGVGKKPTTVALELGISKSTVSNWKKGGHTPHAAQLQKIADYFGVTVDFLLGKEKAPTAGESSEREELTEEIMELFLKLSPKSQAEAQKYIRYLAQQESEENL